MIETTSTKRGTTVTIIGWRIPTPDKPGPASAIFDVRYKDGSYAERVYLNARTGTTDPDPKRWRPMICRNGIPSGRPGRRTSAGLSEAMRLAKAAWASGTCQKEPDYVFGWARPGFFQALS